MRSSAYGELDRQRFGDDQLNFAVQTGNENYINV
jgi:hypothetical protein